MKAPLKLFLSALLGGHCMSAAAISFDVTFDDPSRSHSRYYFALVVETYVAGATWNNYLQSDANLDVRIGFSDNLPTAEGYSATSVSINEWSSVYEQGAAAQSRTGIDPNGSAPDIYINVGSDYLKNELWFDPTFFARTAPVPTDKIDATSVFLLEFGHALVFNGWRDPLNGNLPSDYQSTFDELVVAEGDNLYFTGEGAMREYGKDKGISTRVPLTFGNYAHLGNEGTDLASDLMNGVAINYGERYFISDLDVAILADTGLFALPSVNVDVGSPANGGVLAPAPVNAVPLPGAVWLFASGLFGLMSLSRFNERT